MKSKDNDEVNTVRHESDTLLVLNKDNNTVEMVQGIDKEGNLKKVPPEHKDSNQFMRVDKHGDLFSNFFINFYSQLKNPTHFSFFKVSEYGAVERAKKLQRYVNNSSTVEKERLKPYEVSPNILQTHKNKFTMESTSINTENNEYRYKPEQIDWNTMEKFGLNQEKLEKMNALDPLLRGFKTPDLIPVIINLGTAVSKMDIRLSLQTNDVGEVAVHLHGIRREPNLNRKFLGHEFTEDDKKNLLETGNMGRVVDLINPKTGEIIPSIISRDRLTNELIALRSEYIKIPDEIKGVKLDKYQSQTLQEGRPLYIEGMISKKGEPFNATVQFNADKRYVEFLFDRSLNNRQSEEQNKNNNLEVPRVFRGKELDEMQYSQFKEGQTVYVSELIDGKGKEYQGYITFNENTGKTAFSFNNPNKLKEKAVPSEDHKTQIAVNSEGKTNESTKKIKEPLQPKQKEPATKKQADQMQKPTKARGKKL